MAGMRENILVGFLAVTTGLLFPGILLADSDLDALKAQVEALTKQLEEVRDALEVAQQQQTKQHKETTNELATVKKEVGDAAEWKSPNSLLHMAGYADVGYTNGDDDDGSFNVGSFSPIFHFQYRDVVMLESELELTISPEGETDIELEYMAMDYFINDYMTLVGGKFLSPIGQFRQNLHPSWINKMPKAPPGFGHDGAAPVSDVGFQLRGGIPIGPIRSTYALYVSNGPELTSVLEDDEYALEGIEAEGFGNDRDGKKVFGGRFSILPVSALELGISAATGKATVTGVEDEATGEVTDIDGETARDYDVIGADFSYAWRGLGIRGEYVRSKIGDAGSGLTASAGSEWSSWYLQSALRFPSTSIEAVLRYADVDSPHPDHDQQQWALGLNYLITNSFIAKGAYEFNDGMQGSPADADLFLLQLAYGF